MIQKKKKLETTRDKKKKKYHNGRVQTLNSDERLAGTFTSRYLTVIYSIRQHTSAYVSIRPHARTRTSRYFHCNIQ